MQTATDELRGYRAWKAGDLKRAARLWDRPPVPIPWKQYGYRAAIWRGDLYRELEQLQKAEGWYLAAWKHPVAHERLGRLYERMNRPEKAATAYERFIESWNDADEGLEDRVKAAQQRLQQVTSADRGGAFVRRAPRLQE